MSKPSALPSPRERGRAGRRRPRRRPGPERTLQAPARAASSAGATPPEDCITSGAGSPRSVGRLAEPAEVAAEQRGEVGVDRRWSSSARTRGTAAGPRARRRRGRRAALRAGARRSRRSWRGVEVGEEQADRDRLGAALARSRRRAGPARPSAQRLDHALGPDPLARPRSAARARPAAPASARRGGRARGGSGGRSRAGRRSPRWRPAPSRAPRSSSRALVPTVIPWAKTSTSAGVGAGPLEHRLDRRASRPSDWSSGRGRRPWRCGASVAVEEDRVGEGPADVDPEQHARSLSERRIAPGRAKGPGDAGAPLAVGICSAWRVLPTPRRAAELAVERLRAALSGISALSNVSSRCLCDGQ